MPSRTPFTTDILADALAADETVSDYDLWREIRSLHQQVYELERGDHPIPIHLLYRLRTAERARQARQT